MKDLVLVMGISGAGKTTVGQAVAQRLGLPFLDADDFHPAANKNKMAQGIPLTDDDRWPWLQALADHIVAGEASTTVVACSALKQGYRDFLARHLQVHIVYLALDQALAEERLRQRQNHFMPVGLVPSQLSTLEPPSTGLKVAAQQPLEDLVNQIADHLHTLNILR